MDKELDYQRYHELVICLPHEGNFLGQRKAHNTRIIKLSAAKSKYSFAGIGRMSLESGQFQKSLIQLKRALVVDPDSSYAQMSLAEVLLKLEKQDEAFFILKRILSLDSGYTWTHQIIIKRLKERERLADLDSFYQEICNTYTDEKSVADLYCGSAHTLTSLNEHSKALEMYKKMYKANPNAGYNYQYAFALYHEGEFEEARAQFKKLWEWNPTHRIFASNVAFMTYCTGRLQEAFEEFEEIIANGLVSHVAYSNLVLVSYHLDKDEEVINRYKDLLQQNLGEEGPLVRSMYEEALRITRLIVERDDIDEENREFNRKKIEGINFVLSFIN